MRFKHCCGICLMLLWTIGLSPNCFAQKVVKHNASKYPSANLDIGASYTPVLNYSFWGLHIDFKGYVTKKYSTGFSFTYSGKQIGYNFGYVIKQPIINFSQFGWVNKYDLFKIKGVVFFGDLVNAFGDARLGDKSEMVKTGYTKYGPVYRPKRIAENYYYILEPGFGLSIPIYKTNDNDLLYLTTKFKYRFAFGKGTFSTSDQFSNYEVCFGITLIN